MRHPWHALVRLLAESRVSSSAELRLAAREAWTETASRMDLVRLGWWASQGDGEPTLAFPVPRALIRCADPLWRRAGAPDVRPRTARCMGEDEVAITVGEAVLVAASSPGRLPSYAGLIEVACLAQAVAKRLGLEETRERVSARLSQADATAAAGHDLRNELTRALLFAGRGQAGDGAEVLRALGAARELAHSALLPQERATVSGVGTAKQNEWEPFDLRAAVTEEVRAAAAAVRAPQNRAPSVRLKCPKGVLALTNERLFRRALRNIVLNAMEASVRHRKLGDAPRAVTVLVEELPDVTASGYRLRLSVRDEGTGMTAPEVDAFLETRGAGHGAGQHTGQHRGQRAGTVSPDGMLESTGLGTASLALALSAGEIPLRVESAVGRGTTVTLWLRSVAEVGAEALVDYVIDTDCRRALRTAADLRSTGREVWIRTVTTSR